MILHVDEIFPQDLPGPVYDKFAELQEEQIPYLDDGWVLPSFFSTNLSISIVPVARYFKPLFTLPIHIHGDLLDRNLPQKGEYSMKRISAISALKMRTQFCEMACPKEAWGRCSTAPTTWATMSSKRSPVHRRITRKSITDPGRIRITVKTGTFKLRRIRRIARSHLAVPLGIYFPLMFQRSMIWNTDEIFNNSSIFIGPRLEDSCSTLTLPIIAALQMTPPRPTRCDQVYCHRNKTLFYIYHSYLPKSINKLLSEMSHRLANEFAQFLKTSPINQDERISPAMLK